MRFLRLATLLIALFAPVLASFPLPALAYEGNTIDFGPHRLSINSWGAGPGEVLTSGVFLNEDKTFGWYWDRPSPVMKPGDSFVRPIYPNVRVGASPSEKSNTNEFPIRLVDLKSLTFDVSYEYTTAPTGAYNLSYEMYLSDTTDYGPNVVPKAEVMVWVHRTFTQPADAYQGLYTDSINSYLLYSWVQANGKLYASFIMAGDPVFKADHFVDARALLDQLNLDPQWYLLGVQLGSEVVNGSGRIQISSMVVNVNGSKL